MADNLFFMMSSDRLLFRINLKRELVSFDI